MLTQIKYYRRRFIKYAIKNVVTQASIRYKIIRKTIYKWLKRYDGTLESLEDLSKKHKTSPRKHTYKEVKIIKRLITKYNNDIILIKYKLLKKLIYQILKEKFNYNKSYGGLKAFIRKLINPTKNKKATHKCKEYKRADYIGQKVQIDVKYVPSKCVTNGKKYYQYTAVDGVIDKCMKKNLLTHYIYLYYN